MGYDTAMSTWIGDHVPYARRGQIIGLSELSWAVALLVGIPLVGALIDAVGWRAPFVVVGVVCVAVGLLLPARIEADPPRPPGPHARLRLLPGAVALYVVMGLLSFSMQLVIVVHGFWLEDEFGLTVAAIGISSILLGAGELAGSGATVSLTDRLGKRRSVLVGSVALVPPLALFGITDGRVAVALALLTLAVLAFEFAFVSALPLVTELDPEARGSAVGVALAVVTVTRALGTVAATTLYSAQGMGAVGGAAAAGIAIAAVVVATAVQEPEPTTVTV